MNSVHSSTHRNAEGSKDVEQRDDDDDDDEEKRNVQESRSVQRVNRDPLVYSYRLFRLLILLPSIEYSKRKSQTSFTLL